MKNKQRAEEAVRTQQADTANKDQRSRVLRQLDVCILCGVPVPEGMLICPNCERELEYERLH